MKMQPPEIVVWALAGMGVLALLYWAQQSDDTANVVPQVQSELQVMGLGVQAGMRINAGTPLDMSQHLHGWHPGYDPDPTGQPVTVTAHRYPAIPGGNISTVMHKGWQAAVDSTPAGNDWFITPPEAATL
jgi:hypothetical protein